MCPRSSCRWWLHWHCSPGSCGISPPPPPPPPNPTPPLPSPLESLPYKRFRYFLCKSSKYMWILPNPVPNACTNCQVDHHKLLLNRIKFKYTSSGLSDISPLYCLQGSKVTHTRYSHWYSLRSFCITTALRRLLQCHQMLKFLWCLQVCSWLHTHVSIRVEPSGDRLLSSQNSLCQQNCPLL